MLQSIGEGVSLLLQGNGFNLNLVKIFKNWSNGSVVRGWLVELMERGLREQDYDKIPSYVEIPERLTGYWMMLLTKKSPFQ